MKSLTFNLLLSALAVVNASGSRPHGASKARISRQNVQRWDFTNIANPRVPAPIEDWAQSQAAEPTHEYFSSSEWSDVWAIMNWGKEATDRTPTAMTNTLNNVYIQPNADPEPETSTFLTLRTVHHAAGFQSAAEFQTRLADYQYVTMKMRARTVGDAGACTAMFTYLLPEGGKVQEADLEILTKETNNKVHYTNQPSYDENGEYPEATREVDLATSWNNWQDHTMVWSPGKTEWFVDGVSVAVIEFQAPVDPAFLLFNSWSDGGVWTGSMPVGGSAELQIQWIEITEG